MTTNEKIAKIRELMKRDQIQALIIPSGDPHMSEYFSDHWRTGTYISGFTGEAGTWVITTEISGLWTDGRFYVQAQNQLAGTEVVLFRASEPDCPSYTQYLHDTLPENSVVALNGKLFNVDQGCSMFVHWMFQPARLQLLMDLSPKILLFCSSAFPACRRKQKKLSPKMASA